MSAECARRIFMQKKEGLPRYIGGVHPNCDYHHGQIFPARGVKCYQIARANRTHPEWDDGTGCTYKHAADPVYFAGRFYVQYLVNPQSEHTGAGYSVLASSTDGAHWEDFQASFPEYLIPACEIRDRDGELHTFDGNSYAIMHQRMSFYQASNGRMLVSGFYGFSPQPWMTPWDTRGIGRVVRELFPDGSLGGIFFILPCWQAGWTEELLRYPLYQNCPDAGFVEACGELLADRLAVQQWAEENGDKEDLIAIKHPKTGRKNEAFCWYHIDGDTVIGLWKHSMTARSDDGGETWGPVTRSPSLVMSGQKVWGCRTSDGRFAMVYDPTLETQHRYPLCVTVSEDGLDFDKMRLVHGEVPPMKFEGFWKDLGPQYMRGISEGLPQPPDGDLWVAYSVNKEDVWIARIPVPVLGEEQAAQIAEDFSRVGDLAAWNLYSPKWAPAELVPVGGKTVLRLVDRDPYDYCRAERILKPAARMRIAFAVTPRQDGNGCLYAELLDAKGVTAVRLVFRDDGKLYARTVCELPAMEYQAGKVYEIAVEADCTAFRYRISVNGEALRGADGEPVSWIFMSAVNEISRFVLRTGESRHEPTLDYIPDGKPAVPLAGCDEPCREAAYDIERFSAEALE